MTTDQIVLTKISEAYLTRVAYILGESSAAAKALMDAERRRTLGEDVAFYHDEGSQVIFVGPPIVENPDVRIIENADFVEITAPPPLQSRLPDARVLAAKNHPGRNYRRGPRSFHRP